VATVLDLFSRRIVGWSMDKNIDRHLVIRALMMAVWKRQPKATVLVHSDQGSQYSSADYVAFLQANNLKPSMSPEEIVMTTLLQKASLRPLKNA